MANWLSLNVKDAIRKINDSEIVLPVIQRRLVWNEEKMEILFDSLLKGNSFGSIICIEEEKDREPLFAFRKFTDDGNDVSSIKVETLTRSQLLVVDGQQRLQSFFIGLIGSYRGKRMFFDLYSNHSEGEYDFKFASNPIDLPKINKERRITNCIWYPVKDLFQKLSDTGKARQVAKELIKECEINEDDKIDCIETNVQDFFDAIFANDSIGISKVSINKEKDSIVNRQRIVELFRRLNDGGTTLSSYDLVASMFKGFDYKMEQFLDTVVAENSDIGINQDVLIKLLLILNDKPTKEMSDLTAEDAEFATSNYERIQVTLKTLKKFLVVSSHSNWFSSAKNRSAIPLYFLAYHIFYSKFDTKNLINMFDKHDTNDKNYHEMAVWLRLSLLNKVFSRGSGWIPYKTGIKKIHGIIQKQKKSDFESDKLFDVYKNHPLNFNDKIRYKNLDSFDREYIFYLLYNAQPSTRNEDIDHIQPRSLLLANKFDEQLINNIANYQLLDCATNRGKKNDKELYVWINNLLGSDNRSYYINRHQIPNQPNLWKVEQFKEFLEERAKLIVLKIKELL